MIKLFFEDKNVTIMNLLNTIYSESDDVKLYFVGGCGNFHREKFIKEYTGDVNILFVDVVPDNYVLVREVTQIAKKLRKIPNIYIVPVVSMDYYVTCAYLQKFVPSLEHILHLINTKEDIRNIEDALKYIVDTSVSCIALGRYNDTIGEYYTNDCSCDSCDSTNARLTTKRDKAIRLITQYPVYPKGTNVNGVKADILEIILNQIDKYNHDVDEYVQLSGNTNVMYLSRDNLRI